jgi:hypothetical protein
MARHLRTAFVLVLLAATTVAFVVTERLKLEPAPITDTHVTSLFAPECDCPTLLAHVEFRLRRPETLTVSILDPNDAVVRTLRFRQPLRAGRHDFTWDGRDDSGAIVPEASYQPRVEFGRDRRAIDLPNAIRVDTTPPRIRLVSVEPRTISPDDDGRRDRVRLVYRQSERAQPLLIVDGRVRVRVKSAKLEGKLDWYGKVRRKRVEPGVYRLRLTTRDLAGNLAVAAPTFRIHVRFVEVRPRVLRVRPGAIFRLRISTDALRVRWRIGARTGTATPPVLRLRAPTRPGRHLVVVGYGGDATDMHVVVRRG